MLTFLLTLTLTLFGALFPLFLWIIERESTEVNIHRFVLGLSAAASATALLLTSSLDLPDSGTVGLIWLGSLSAVTVIYWRKSRASSAVVTVPSLAGIWFCYHLVAYMVSPGATAAAAMFLGGLIFSGSLFAMILGHWYLVQPGLARGPLLELVRWTGWTWPFELAVLLWPTGMVSVLDGSIDDGYNGLLGWFWVACTVATIALVAATRAALRERQYSAVMAATGLLYLAILTAFGMDLVARATLA